MCKGHLQVAAALFQPQSESKTEAPLRNARFES